MKNYWEYLPNFFISGISGISGTKGKEKNKNQKLGVDPYLVQRRHQSKSKQGDNTFALLSGHHCREGFGDSSENNTPKETDSQVKMRKE